MTNLVRLSSCAVLCAALAAPAAAADNTRACIAKTTGVYGFQCHGSVSVSIGGPLEPVTFVGTVEGDREAVFEGYGTFNSSNGSASTHVKGNATFGRNCFGHVLYTTNDVLDPDGNILFSLPPVAFDFAVVDEGQEILGSGVAYPPGVTGDFVPRLTCRLVKVKH